MREIASSSSPDYTNLVTLRGGGHVIAGTLTGRRSEARIVLIDDHTCDIPPAENMLVVRNDDRPGVIGIVGTMIGEAEVNIADMGVAKAAEPGSAIMVIATATNPPVELLARLREAPGIISVHSLHA